MGMEYRGFDLDIFPGVAALEDAFAQGFSWCASYLPAPSHSNAGWPSYPILAATKLKIAPVWVGAQIEGPGSHAVGAAQGKIEGQNCVSELTTRQYPPGSGVVFDTENGAPLSPLQQAHLTAWRDAVRAGGFRPMVYGSYENFVALALIFAAEDVWEFELLPSAPNNFSGVAIQWEQSTPLRLAGYDYNVDLSASTVADPAAGAAPVIAETAMTMGINQDVGAATAEQPNSPALAAPIPVVVTAPAPVPVTTKVTQAGPPIAAGLMAAATAAVGAVHVAAYHVDLSGLVDAAAPFLIAGVILPLIVWGFGRGLQLMHLSAQSTAAQFVLTAVENAVRSEAQQGLTYVDNHAVVTLSNQAAANVLNYVNTAVPKRLAASGISPDQLGGLIANRLNQVQTPQS